MKNKILLIFTLSIFATAFAGEWKPSWKPVELPNIEGDTYYGKHHSIEKSGELVVWVYINHGSPRQAKYLKKKKFSAEIQEWVLNCKNTEGSVATIRYTNSTDPNILDNLALVHPGGKLTPERKQREVLCELNT